MARTNLFSGGKYKKKGKKVSFKNSTIEKVKRKKSNYLVDHFYNLNLLSSLDKSKNVTVLLTDTNDIFNCHDIILSKCELFKHLILKYGNFIQVDNFSKNVFEFIMNYLYNDLEKLKYNNLSPENLI